MKRCVLDRSLLPSSGGFGLNGVSRVVWPPARALWTFVSVCNGVIGDAVPFRGVWHIGVLRRFKPVPNISNIMISLTTLLIQVT